MSSPGSSRLRFASALFVTLSICVALLPLLLPRAKAASEAQPRAVLGRLFGQSKAEADAKSAGCITCHTATDSATMHATATVQLGCVDCHGGKPEEMLPPGVAAGSPEYEEVKLRAHVRPRHEKDAASSANPVRAYTRWMQESEDWVQFVNPGDLRVAARSCG